jgi:hypothetical protein
MQLRMDAAIAARKEALKRSGLEDDDDKKEQEPPKRKKRKVIPRVDDMGQRYFEVEDIEELNEPQQTEQGEVI